MSPIIDFLSKLPKEEKSAFQRIIDIVRECIPEVKDSLSYGMPTLKINDRPLIGFSSNKYGLNIYPFDSRVITDLKNELDGFETSKGVIRFTIDQQLTEELIVLIIDTRLGYIKK